ncbi:hypothetical protein FKM82_026730 [Ascaphus truei]
MFRAVILSCSPGFNIGRRRLLVGPKIQSLETFPGRHESGIGHLAEMCMCVLIHFPLVAGSHHLPYVSSTRFPATICM